jgi:uroporphyrin-III C-methyltransferase
MTGRVYIVGAGPGAADLLTLRAVRVLEKADVVFHDALISSDVLALAAKARTVAVGKRCGRHSTAQHFINKRLADAARSHDGVVRLKGGDPMLFGRAHEEIGYLRSEGIAVEVVPGVTAALAASAELGVSLTRRGMARSVAFVTPRVGEGERASSWVDAVLAADSVAIYMGAGEAEAISCALMQGGKPADTPVALVEDASLPSRRVQYASLRELPSIGTRGGAALILLGEVYREALRSTRSSDASLPAPARSAASRARAQRG